MRLALVICSGLLLVAASSCATERAAPQSSTGPAGNPPVHSIQLPHFQSNLPEGSGREAFALACLSCHSTTYVTMQPSLSAAKWEEVVDKMTKVYAAPIAAQQIPQIVQYIMATKEAGSRELQETRTNTSAAEVPAIALPQAPDRRAADLKRGEGLFATNCASCHGPRGEGDGASALSQLPHPTNLKTTRFSTEALATAVVRGVPATAMPGFPNLSGEDLRAVIAFSQQLLEDTAVQPPPSPSAEELAQARSLFAQNCTACHGERGAGDGPLAATSPRPPANFRAIQPTRSAAERVIGQRQPTSKE